MNNFEQITECFDLAEKNKIKLFVGYNRRFLGSVLKLKKIISNQSSIRYIEIKDQQDTNKAYQDLLHKNKLEYEKEIKKGKSPTFTTPEILLKDRDGKPLASQKYLTPEFAQKLSAYMADYNKKKQNYDNYQKKKKKDDKKTPQNQVPRDYYKKSFNVPNPENFSSFEFIEGFRY